MNLANEKKTIPTGEKVSANRAPYWLKYPKTVSHRNNSPRVDSIQFNFWKREDEAKTTTRVTTKQFDHCSNS